MLSGYELEQSRQRNNSPLTTVFEDLWPSETRGDGSVRRNNQKTGAAQGKGSFIQKAPCRQCGFPNDLTRIDHSGGSIDGNGACYVASTATATYTLTNGTTATENYGNPGIRNGAGCAMCGTKNSTKQRTLLTGGNPWDKVQPLGF